MTCEYCKAEATHADHSALDPDNSMPGCIAYRDRYLCHAHAVEAGEVATSRVRCLHTRLDADGMCYSCGRDCRVIGGTPCK
jgi:hypothetical protein